MQSFVRPVEDTARGPEDPGRENTPRRPDPLLGPAAKARRRIFIDPFPDRSVSRSRAFLVKPRSPKPERGYSLSTISRTWRLKKKKTTHAVHCSSESVKNRLGESPLCGCAEFPVSKRVCQRITVNFMYDFEFFLSN